MLIRTDNKLLNNLDVTLYFDDSSVKKTILKVGDRHKITYIENEQLETVEGVITNIIPHISDVVIYMDCSNQFKSKEVKLYSNMIRDIYVDLLDQHGITFSIDDMVYEKNYITSNIKYDNELNGTTINLFFDINSKTIDPDILEGILKQVSGINSSNGILHATLTVKFGDKKYKKANKYSSDEGWNNHSLVLNKEVDPIIDNKIDCYPFSLKIYYRLLETDPWLEGSTLPEKSDTIIDIGDQLATAIKVDRSKLYKVYGELFRFEPARSNTEYNYRFDIYGEEMNLLGTEYFALRYDNKFKPSEIKFTNEVIELVAESTLQLVGKVYPEKISIPAITFTSSDILIATVDNTGLITAVSEGNVVITAYPSDNKEVIKTFEIKVTKKPEPPIEPDPEPDPEPEPEV